MQQTSRRGLPLWPALSRQQRQALDVRIAGTGSAGAGGYWPNQPRDYSPAAKKNRLKPWRKVMWCIGALTRNIGSECTTCSNFLPVRSGRKNPSSVFVFAVFGFLLCDPVFLWNPIFRRRFCF